jgi:hypothetical protein
LGLIAFAAAGALHPVAIVSQNFEMADDASSYKQK